MDSEPTTSTVQVDKAEWLSLAIIVRELGHTDPDWPIVYRLVERLQQHDDVYQPELFKQDSNIVRVKFGSPVVHQ